MRLRKARPLAPVIVLLPALAACPSMPTGPDAFAHRTIGEGDTLSLTRPLTVEPLAARVYLQYGAQVLARELNELRPHCVLMLDTVSEHRRRVPAGSFRITRVNWGTSTLPERSGVVLYMGRRGSTSRLYYITDLDLESPVESDVRRLSCRVDRMLAGGPSSRSYLSVVELREALGALVRLEPPTAPR